MSFLAAIGYPFWALYHYIFYLPSLNGLIWLYGHVHDLGLSIILLTLAIRIILFPLYQKGVRYQTSMQKLQPAIKELQKKHKGNYEEQSKAMMDLYKEHNVSPLSGTLSLFIQLPILIALYRIFLSIFNPDIFTGLYPFVVRPETLSPIFFGLINLAKSNIVMVILAAAAQFFQGYLSLPKSTGVAEDPMVVASRRMIYFTPIITLVIFSRLPAAVGLYWLVTSLFSIGQQLYVNNQLHHGKLGTIHTDATP